jgi:ferredoxin
MISNYGYEDGSGFYYITIDGDACAKCATHGCVNACPQSVYVLEVDDYDDLVAAVTEATRRRLRETCSPCKGQNGTGGTEQRSLPCTDACPEGALRHSW